MDKLTGIHAVKEALEAQRPIDRIAIAKGRQDTRVEEIVQLARKQGVPVRFEERGQLDRLANSRDHQGVVALAGARAGGTLEDILKDANESRGLARFDAQAMRLCGETAYHGPGEIRQRFRCCRSRTFRSSPPATLLSEALKRSWANQKSRLDRFRTGCSPAAFHLSC